MPDDEGFDRNVFVNCPLDADFAPVMEAMLFCIVDCDLIPRFSSERLDSGEARLDKIVGLMSQSRYSIHDLSRLQATEVGEFARLNMPFELGIDYGLKSGGANFVEKRILVTAAKKYDYQVALSDIAGWDIRHHSNDYQRAIAEIRRWLHALGLTERAPTRIKSDYEDRRSRRDRGNGEWPFRRTEVLWRPHAPGSRPRDEALGGRQVRGVRVMSTRSSINCTSA